MAKFTYEPEYDSHGDVIGTTIKETGGYFAGWKPDDLAEVAEKFTPNYQSHDMSNTFYTIFFNHTLRKELEKKCSSQ